MVASAQELKLKEPVKFLALGDSYTIGQSVSQSGRWPVQLMDSLDARGIKTGELRIIAKTGWRTDNLMQMIQDQDPPKDYNLVSLLIGVNDQYQGYDTDWYEPRFTELLQKAIELAGGDKTSVFVLSIPDYAYTPFGQQSNPSAITEDINAFNSMNRTITENLGIGYIDITPISRLGLDNTDLVASDGLHQSALMYSQWVDLVLNELLVPEIISMNEANPGENGVNVYPNPFADTIEFKLDGTGSKELKIAIYNASGQIVKQISSVTGSRIHIDASAFEPGIYFYYLVTAEGEFRGKIVKV